MDNSTDSLTTGNFTVFNGSVFDGIFGGSLSFKVKDACKAENLNIDCSITFDSAGQIQTYGGLFKGQIPANADIAGIGIWISLIPGLLVVLIGCIYILLQLGNRCIPSRYRRTRNARNQLYDPHDQNSKFKKWWQTGVIKFADTQIILALAFGFNFAAMSKCTLTSYHFRVALDTILISLSAVVLSVALVRGYCQKPAAAIIRLGFSVFIFICFGVTLAAQEHISHFPEWPPQSSNTTDGLLLLPAACLLDPTLFDQLNASLAQAPPSAIVANNLQLDKLTTSVEYIFFALLVLAGGAAMAANIVRLLSSKHHSGKLPFLREGSCEFWIALIYYPFVFFVPIVTFVVCMADISIARGWASSTGWFQGEGPKNIDPETRLVDIGQFLALLNFGLVVVGILENWHVGGKRDGKDSHNSHA